MATQKETEEKQTKAEFDVDREIDALFRVFYRSRKRHEAVCGKARQATS